MNTNPNSKSRLRSIGRLLLVALAAAGLSGLATAFVLSSGQQPAIAQPAPARIAAATAKICRKTVPRDPGSQDEDDPRQTISLRNFRPPAFGLGF